MSERVARVVLSSLVEPGLAGPAALVAEHGAEAALREVQRRNLGRAGLDPGEVPPMVAAMAARGVRLLVPGDPEWPSQVEDLPEPPLCLWVRGPLDLRAAALRSVAVVGSRACTAYGERATTQIAGGLADLAWSVVSGAAFGIDAAAHRAALGVQGATVAVLAGGVDVPYPRAHEPLLGRIGDVGAVVSEGPPGSQPLRHRFLARNRLIAALSRGTVVVEAAHRSGALATAARAHELGRVVMAVPGPITSMASSGTNRLLHDQTARAVSSPEQVLPLLTGDGSARSETAGSGGWAPGGVTGEREAPAGPLGEVLSALPRRGGRSVEEVAARTGLPQIACLAHLGVLELQGHARRASAGWRRAG